MKVKLLTLGTLASLGLAALTAHASVLLQDNFSYIDGPLTNVSAGKWVQHSGNLAGMQVVSGALQVSASLADDCNSSLTGAPYASNSPTAALYSSFTLNVSTLPTAGGAYFAHFKDAGLGSAFRGRIYVGTTGAGAGSYRLSIANNSGTQVPLATDLTPGTTYTVVTRYVLGTGIATLWLSPANETVAGTVATDAITLANAMSTYAFRQATGEGVILIDNLVVGSTFADVVPASAGFNPPFISVQPVGTNVASGTAASFRVIAGGDNTLGYQWTKDSTPIAGATASAYTIASTVVGDTGAFAVVVTNAAGTITSSAANLAVSFVATPPSITNQPQSLTVAYGDTATFSVGVAGTQPLTYRWTFNGTNLPGATSSALAINNAFTNNAGPYQVVVTNAVGAATSSVVTLTVTAPPLTNIAFVHSTVDTVNYRPTNTTALYTIEGIVTTWGPLTPAGNVLFYMQDATAGIAVFWGGAPDGSQPNAGDRVRVTAPVTSFNGLLESSPVFTNVQHSVVIVSTGNALPTPVPVPFDASQNDPIVMDALEGTYVVASNVVLDASSTTFISASAGENLTDTNGQTFSMFINASTDIPSQTKPEGTVTVYGVLGQFDASDPRTSGYQIIPSRYADIVSGLKGATARFTNVLENLGRLGNPPTNTVAENVLRPGEKLTMSVTVTNYDGGSVTITPLTAGLPASASWSTGPLTGTNVATSFVFQPVQADAGVNYTIALRMANSSVVTTNTWTVYVPTLVEQKIYISEFLANPTSDSNSPSYNPLHRPSVQVTSVTTADEYVEIANLSGTDVDLYNWSIADAVSVRHRFFNGAPSETLGASNAIVVFGGPANTNTPVLSVPAFPADVGSSPTLALNDTGSETIILRNATSNIVDRVVYNGTNLATGVSLSRFPTVNDAFVLQSYVSTNSSTVGGQYDGGAWNQVTKVPAAVSGVVVTAGNPLSLSFTALTNKASTLWQADNVGDHFRVVNGRQFPTVAGSFSITNPPPAHQFYFITTQ
ncbi:MAG: hypothetical protein JWR69_2797 [Pedosphaera sp.]|nr:hypothetical protein [Pedosphaera sp.]